MTPADIAERALFAAFVVALLFVIRMEGRG